MPVCHIHTVSVKARRGCLEIKKFFVSLHVNSENKSGSPHITI